MQKAAAQRLVRETLQDSFDREHFVWLVKNVLNKFDESKALHARGYVKEKFKNTVRTYERIGTYTDANDKNNDKKIDLLIVHLQRASSIERARTSLRNFVADYLKQRGMKDAALVAFVAPNGADWRFSFVKMEYKFDEEGKVKEEFTPARRYSFLVGENENSHTAQSRLVPILLNDEVNPTLEQLEEAFSVERVTKEFFEKYHDLFSWLKGLLDDGVEKDAKIKADFKEKNISSADFAKKLLGQIVFLYFLQKKGWFGVARDQEWGSGSRRFLRELFEKKHGSYRNFFNDILEPLFYEALRLERPSDDYYSRFKCRIPFLNGGLFDPLGDYDWQKTNILLPDDLFSNDRKTKEGDEGDGVLDIFDRYNFTVKEDEPLEKEVAIDPEMLGKVFENILEAKDRKSKGTYYTPREIVHYMCQESLINYLAAELGLSAGSKQTDEGISKEDIETLIKYGEAATEHDSRVVDKGRETERYPFKLPQSVRERAQLIDDKLAAVRVCDPAVGSGAFPVGMMNEIVRTRNTLTAYLPARPTQTDLSTDVQVNKNEQRSPYHFKRHAIQNCLYGVDIDPGAVEITKLRLYLSLVVDEEERDNIRPLPNLDYKIVQGNSLLSVDVKEDIFRRRLFFPKLEELKTLYFSETNAGKKQEYRKQINDRISWINGGQKSFSFEVYFSEVFHDLPIATQAGLSACGNARAGKSGFDVVIANPPYVKEYVNRSAFDGLRNSPYYQGKIDLWYMFACGAIDVLKEHGILAFIAQNNWVTSHGASKMRNKIMRDTQILNLSDFGAFKIFEAGIQTMVMIFQKNAELENYSFDYRRLLGDDLEISNVVALLNKRKSAKIEYLTPEIEKARFIDKPLTFSSSDIQRILGKILENSNFNMDSIEEVAQGIVSPQDYVNRASQKALGENFKIGAGIFTLSTDELKALPLSRNELQLIRPFYTTDELSRWQANSHNQRWIIYTDSSFKNKKKLKNYPNVKKHLDQFKKVITSDNGPYGLHRARNEYFFKGEKIIAVRKCARPTFTYVYFDSYVSATFYIIKTKRVNQKYLVGLLNSQLIAFWLRHKGKMQGTNYQVDKEPLVNLPLIRPDLEVQRTAERIVNKIFAITKEDDYLENATKQVKVREHEKQIDRLVYKLYGLTEDEIKIMEGK